MDERNRFGVICIWGLLQVPRPGEDPKEVDVGGEELRSVAHGQEGERT